jgi:poly(A) polymerase
MRGVANTAANHAGVELMLCGPSRLWLVSAMFRLFSRHKHQSPAPDEHDYTVSDALLAPRPSDIFVRWKREGRLREVLPDLEALVGVSQAPAHRDDAFVHTLKVVDAIEPTPVRRWAALLHDIGKGPTYIEAPDGRSRFFGHDEVGTAMVPEIMQAAGEPPGLIASVQRLVGLHMRPISYNHEWTDSAVRRLKAEAEEDRGPEGWEDLLALARADLRGYLPEPIDRGLWVLDSLEEHARRLDEEEAREREAAHSEPRSPLNGDELVALAQREPGAWVGRLKDYLTELVRHGALEQDDATAAREAARLWLNAVEPNGDPPPLR